MLTSIFIIFLFKLSTSEQNRLFSNDHFGILTENFIENLRADPFLIGVSKLSEIPKTAKEFINNHTEQYSELILTSQQKEYSRSKRSFLRGSESNASDNIAVISLYPISFTTPSNDISIFKQNSSVYLVILQTTSQNGSNLMMIMKKQEKSFKIVVQKKIEDGVRMTTFSFVNTTLIVVAQNNNITKIFEFNSEEKIETLETIQKDGCKDIAIWEDNGNVFMSLVGFMGNSPVPSSYFPRLYKWRGRHFDDLQDVHPGATRISPFMIGDSGFVAVAYNVSYNGDENENVYSEILKYNVNTEKYELFQKILTYACDDIKYFEIDTVEGTRENEKDRFLVVANSYKKDSTGKSNRREPSIIIYKFVDNYFYPFQSITSDGVFQWEIIKNRNGDVLLIALTLKGLKTFEYDGWNFIETTIEFQGRQLKNMSDVRRIRTFIIEDKQLLVLARTSSNESLFQVNYSKKDKLKELHDQLLTWCQEKKQDMTKRIEILQKMSKIRKRELQFDSQKQNLETLISTISSYNSKLSTIQNSLKTRLNRTNIIERNLNATLLLLNSTGTFESLFSNTINGIEIPNFLENKININREIVIDAEIEADSIQTKSSLIFNNFNNHSRKHFIYTTSSYELEDVDIHGDAIFKDTVTIRNNLNNINISKETILLKNGDQNLENLRANRIDVTRLNTAAINDKIVEEVIGHAREAASEISNVPEKSNDNTLKEKVERIEKLKVKNLKVDGFINDVDIPILEKYVLRKSGKQNINQTYYIDNVETNWVETDRMSGKKIPEDLIAIDNSSISIAGEVKFEKPISTVNLQVKKRLNNIPVRKGGNLDILFKNSSKNQQVTGLKTFDYLTLLHPIDIRKKIKSTFFDNTDPMKIISSNLTLNRKITISGNVSVENILKVMDIIPQKSQDFLNNTPVSNSNNTQQMVTLDHLSMAKVVQKGVKLDEINITIPLKFIRDINTKKVYTKSVNGLDPSKFVIMNLDHPVDITGAKIFTGNLKILGDIDIKQINGIDVSNLESTDLQNFTDQVLEGDYHIKHVKIRGSLKSNSTSLGKHPWRDVVTVDTNQTLKGVWTLSHLIANTTTVEHFNIKGLINGINLTEFLKDAVPKDTESKIFGTKYFETLNVTNLWINNKFDLDKRVKDIVDGKIIFPTIEKLDSISAENVYFGNKCNGIEKSKFEKPGISVINGTLIVDDLNKFDKIIVMGTVYVESNKLNHVDMDDLEFNTAKIDEPTYFENADFGKSLTVTPVITHHGQIENLDLDNVFENNKNKSQTIMNQIIFKGDVFVNGTMNIGEYLNGVNISDLCGVLSEFKRPKKLIIEGNVHFTKGPRIKIFNGLNASYLENKIWFTDYPASLSGNIAFNNNVVLRDVLTVEGLLNDVNLDYLSNNYLSKSKDQKIVAHIELLNETIFKEEVVSPMVAVGGLVNGINLDKFLKNTLLHRSQLFENMPYFEEISVKHLEGNYLVNKLNLDSEVMRYDRPNLITGTKTFENLNVDVLRPEGEAALTAKIQGVDVLHYLQNAVLNKGSFKIGGNKKFKNIEVREGTSLMGHFNGIKFDTVTTMMRNNHQNITGKKTFVPNSPSGVRFKNLKVKGLVNGVNLEKVLKNLAYKNEDNTFTTDLQFCNNISTKHVEFKTKVSGINVSKLLYDIETLGTLHNIKEKYEALNDMASQVESSLKGQAYFLDYYKSVFMTFKVNELFLMKCFGSGRSIVSFTNESNTNIARFLEWDEKQETFGKISSKKIIGSYPNYITKIPMGNMDRVYIEHPNSSTEDSTHIGRFMVCNKNKLEFLPVPFLTKGSHFLTSFEIKSQNTWCLLFVDFNFDINIICGGENGIFKQQQTIKNKSPIMAYITTIRNIPMLITIHGGNDKKTVIWILNKGKFEISQTYREGEAIDVSAIAMENETFLAIAYKHVPNTKYFGRVVIRRIKNLSKSLQIFQTIDISTPTKVELALLPSKEIALYIITENPSEPLTSYIYKGVQGFLKKIERPTLPKVSDLNSFSFDNHHFVVLKNDKEVKVLQAVFKGFKFDYL
ncbi:uncharacterized protein LOC130446041 isoform X2 [Diorhabda sublineata]|uniref:uncharacterized protein LOC130446041 isoform X2 n=1 Tax=Diorhabda sublineata TaxID=1163346 RepID=UPI0024E0B994|nr:uncharacterized protein LOC130446041 isoform X2 [Diorhabda sublineata]